MVYLGKPTGVTLDEHVSNVQNQVSFYLERHSLVQKKYQDFTGSNLKPRLNVAAKYHDDGKKHSKWQDKCKKDHEEFKSLKDKRKFTAKNLQEVRLRHELVYLDKQLKAGFSWPVLVAIAAHHQQLSHSSVEGANNRWIEAGVEHIWKKLKGFNAFPDEPKKYLSQALLINYEYSGPRYLLQLADHRASAEEEKLGYLPNFEKFDYQFPYQERKEIQEIAEENWKEDLLLLRAPTGSGKTDAALLWAKKQIKNGRADRLIIAMPTRFTSNALTINIAEDISKKGVYHSSSWFNWHYEKSQESERQNQAQKKEFEYSRLLENPVTICTIDHLLIALTMTREDHHGIFFNLANSCLVIDEADFYDDFTQANILVLMEVCKVLNIPVLLMSATLPESGKKIYEKSGFENIEIKEDKSKANIERCQIDEKVDYEDIDELEPYLFQCMQQPSIIYANTVDKAISFYEWFVEEKGYKNVTLYHSRFTEPDKRKIEEELINNLGEEAWQKEKAKGIAIMTQIGEMSVNISADYILTDACPADRLVQRVGRCSRFNDETIGKVVFMIPQKDGELYPAPYGSFKPPNKWEANSTLTDTIDQLKEVNYTSQDFVDLVNTIYSESAIFSAKAEQNAKELKRHLLHNWLIVPKAQTNLEEEETEMWKSRDISPNGDVLVKEAPNFFKTYYEFLNFKMIYSVSLPTYLIQKGEEEHIIVRSKTIIGDREHEYYLVNPGYYNNYKGLVISKGNPSSNILG